MLTTYNLTFCWPIDDNNMMFQSLFWLLTIILVHFQATLHLLSKMPLATLFGHLHMLHVFSFFFLLNFFFGKKNPTSKWLLSNVTSSVYWWETIWPQNVFSMYFFTAPFKHDKDQEWFTLHRLECLPLSNGFFWRCMCNTRS